MGSRSLNPLSCRSIRTRFAYRFLRALKKLSKQRTSTTIRRYHTVKMAAYASMASAVGSKRAWSRALLWKIRNRGLINRSLLKQSRKTRASKRIVEENPKKGSNIFGILEEADQLRKIVPGGEVMDLLSLFDETADYIKCLTSQVQIMRKIVDFYSVYPRTS
ncbi:hypothetical protein ACH5RR_020475 [Cinchona calisaya]|uniref:IBH1-like N-terminal domain-containing protein n=1 Tax=Cinchona calisaya TaxID=153742 RepID=A0ABD2ZGC6_9GENT